MNVLKQLASFAKFDRPLVFYVTDRNGLPGKSTQDLAVRIRLAIASQCDFIQIREKDLSSQQLLVVANDAVLAAAARSTRILLNDRLDVAIASGAAGVHVGGSSIPLGATKQYAQNAPPDFLFGVSCHSLEEARDAEKSGASYIFFGPVFDTPSKRIFGAPQGLDRLREVCDSVEIPVVAIGGVNERTAADCIRAGASGIAAIRIFQNAGNEKSLSATIERIHGIKRSEGRTTR